MTDKLTPLVPEINAADLLKLNQEDPQKAERMFNRLPLDQRMRLVLAARGGDRERLVTLDRRASDLVAAMAPDEFARSVMEVGPEDASNLIRLSSDDQLSYLLDVTGWVKDKFSPERYEIWLPLLIDAGAGRLERWFKSTDRELLTLLFNHWFTVVKYLPSQEQQEPPDDLPSFTLDGVYFLSFNDPKSREIVVQALVVLRSELPELYTSLMESMLWEPVSSLAEESLRCRNGRLMDHGFPERMEAMELWAKPHPSETDWESLPTKEELNFLVACPPRSNAVADLLPAGESLPAVLGTLKPEEADRLRAELTYVANCGVVALGAEPFSPEEVTRAARESLGLANIGLQVLSGDDLGKARQVLSKVGLAALARQGAQAIRKLNKDAWVLLREGWLAGIPTNVHVLDAPLDRCLAGLVYPRPRCYDPTLKDGREYRSFVSLADLEQCRLWLDKARFWGRLFFDLMGIDKGEFLGLWQVDVWPEDQREIKTTAILGTWLARRSLGLEGMAPIPADRFAEAVKALQEGLGESLPKEIKESCQAITDPNEAAMSGALLRGSLKRLELELAGLDSSMNIEPAMTWGIITER